MYFLFMPRRLHMRDFSCVIFFFVFFFYEFKCTRSRICELYTIVCVCVEPREIVDKSPAYSRLHIFFFPAQNVSLFARVCIWHIGMQCYMRSSINLSRRQLEKHWHSWKSRLLLNEMNAFICVCRSLSVGLLQNFYCLGNLFNSRWCRVQTGLFDTSINIIIRLHIEHICSNRVITLLCRKCLVRSVPKTDLRSKKGKIIRRCVINQTQLI